MALRYAHTQIYLFRRFKITITTTLQIGYKVVRVHWSCTRVRRRCAYVCAIHLKQGLCYCMCNVPEVFGFSLFTYQILLEHFSCHFFYFAQKNRFFLKNNKFGLMFKCAKISKVSPKLAKDFICLKCKSSTDFSAQPAESLCDGIEAGILFCTWEVK